MLALALMLLASATVAANKQEKVAGVALLNKAKDIQVIADRDQPILEYFQNHRILVGSVVKTELAKVLGTKEPLSKFFVNYASQNDDAAKASTFGAFLDIAPLDKAVAQLLAEPKTATVTLILRRDEKKANLYYVVGYTSRTSVGFFDNNKKHDTDGFSQKDMCFKGNSK
jgi:hypothetical protein